MIGLIFDVSTICAGVLLSASALDKIDGSSNFFSKLSSTLAPFYAVIGGICLTLGISFLLKSGNAAYELISITSGLILLITFLKRIPAIGDFLLKIAKTILPFKVGIGIAAVITGVLALIGFM